MATVTLYARNVARANRMIRYTCEKQIPGDPIASELCSSDPESVMRQFCAIREEHDSGCEKPVAEMVHSFSPAESKTITPELVNKIGHELATTMFPGHQVLVVTHLDRNHYHNHIFVNRYHTETGKLTRDDLRTVRKLRSLNDQICKRYGLSIPNQEKHERQARIPKQVAQMIKVGRFSYIADLMQKADFARSIATSYVEYQSILGQFGIYARIEKKNISYEYPGQKVAKRGKTMGSIYDKAGLEAVFKSNDEKFQSNPKIRTLLETGLQQLKSSTAPPKNILEHLTKATEGHVISGVKDYAQYPVSPRRAARWARSSEEDLTQRSVPIDEMRKARRTSIVAYCRRSGIALEDQGNGVFSIKGRPYVELSDYEWTNKKNKTRGNLIDLVAAHRGITFLEAIAEINGNKRLLLLQQAGGDAQRSYTSFYIPKPQQEKSGVALQLVSDLLHAHGARPDFANALLKSGQAQVSKCGIVRLFAKDHEHSAHEYVRGDDQKWTTSKRGVFAKPFFEQSGTGRKALVYLDPFTFMTGRQKELFPKGKTSDAILALMHPDVAQVDRFLSANQHVDTLQVVALDLRKPSPSTLDFFHILKARYAHIGIQIEFTSNTRSVSHRVISMER